MPGPLSEQCTEIDRQIGQAVFAVNLQAKPDAACQETLATIQDAIAGRMPAGVYRCPPEALHLTVLPIVWVRGDYGLDIRARWADVADEAVEDLNRTARAAPAFELAGARLEVSRAAIFLRFESPPALEALRDGLLAIGRIGPFIRHRPNIVHVTLFRFEAAMPLAPLAETVAAVELPDLRWKVDRLVLCNEEQYPSLRYNILATFDLCG